MMNLIRMSRTKPCPYSLRLHKSEGGGPATGKKNAADDDQSDAEPTRQLTAQEVAILRNLQREDAVDSLKFSTCGAHVYVDGLNSKHISTLFVSRAVAKTVCKVCPSACRALVSGRLQPIAGSLEEINFRFIRASAGGFLMVADSRAFFNFQLQRWQPLSWATQGAYSPVSEVLYVAFTQEHQSGPVTGGPALFVKLGYRELAQENASSASAVRSLIGYCEKKSPKLRLTNVRGAGLFVFSVPQSHNMFARPARAAEASLKTEFLNSSGIVVTPTGHCGEICSFSASLEYFFLEEAPGQCQSCGPLAALKHTLRNFSGNPQLEPLAAQASSGGCHRQGHKKLRAWSAEDVAKPKHLMRCKRATLVTLGLAAALRSRAKRAKLGGAQKLLACRLMRRSV